MRELLAMKRLRGLRTISIGLSVALAIAATPPLAQEPQSLVEQAIEDPRFHWRSSEDQGLRIHYEPGSFAARHRAMLLRSAVASLRESMHFVGATAYDSTMNVFYVDSRERMEHITGGPVSGFADWTGSGVFVVVNSEWRSFEKHEFAHILTMGMWGPPHDSSRWMIEGIAVACDGWCQEYQVDEIAHQLLRQEEFPPLAGLLTDFVQLGEIRAGMYSASVISYIRSTYDAEALRSMWTDGVVAFAESAGTTVDELEKSWKTYLEQTVDPDSEVDLDRISETGCG